MSVAYSEKSIAYSEKVQIKIKCSRFIRKFAQ